MSVNLQLIALLLAVITVVAMVALFLIKIVRHRRASKEAFRSAIYIGALGEIVSRMTLPTLDRSEWAEDPAFRDTLVDFLNFVDGAERDLLVELAHRVGLVDQFHSELVGSRRESVRLRASASLAEIASPSSRDDLRTALSDPSVEVRISAAAGLSILGAPSDVPAILAALEKEDRWAAERMADSLVRFGPAAVQALSNHVLIAGPVVRPVPNHLPIVVRVLGLIGDPRAETALLQALSSDDAWLRLRAAAALGHPWGDRVVRALLRHLVDDDWRVRAQAATALGRHNEPGTLDALSRALRDEAWWVRQNAAASMADIEGGIDALFDALDDNDPFAVDAALAQLMASGYVDDAKTHPERLRLLEQLGKPYLLEPGAG